MFGEFYFSKRQQLLDVVRDTLALAKKTGTEAGPLDEKTGLLTEVTAPFIFTVCGEVNAGKSSFLNGLLGQALCDVDTLPCTKEIHHYLHGTQAADRHAGACFEKRERRLPVLSDFNIIDTPGTNTANEIQQAGIDESLAKADFAFFVFPVSNPWGSATWDCLERMPEDRLNRAIIILQQSEQKDERDLQVILNHMRSLATQRIGQIPPFFAVSATQVMKAKAAKERDRDLYRDSGYDDLERHISSAVNHSFERHQGLRKLYDAGMVLLQNIESEMEDQASEIESRINFIRGLELEIDELRSNHSNEKNGRDMMLKQSFGEVVIKAGQTLSDGLAIFPSLRGLFLSDPLPSRVETVLLDGVNAAIDEVTQAEGKQLITLCQKHWKSVTPKIKERLEIEPKAFETDGFPAAQESFSERMSDAARHAVVKLRLRAMLDAQLIQRRAGLKFLVAIGLLLLTAAGSTGAMGIIFFPFAFLFAGLFILSCAIVQTVGSRKKIVKLFEESSFASRREFVRHLKDDYQDGVRQFFTEYGGMVESLRREVGTAKQAMKPLQEEGHNIFLRLKAVEQEL